MKRLSLLFLSAAATAFLIAGCQSDHSNSAPETTSTNAPDLIVFYSYPAQPHFGHIVRTNAIDPKITIKVTVWGEVKHPGQIEVAKGTSVLEAIKQSGGFDKYGSQRIRINRGKLTYALMIRKELIGTATQGHYRVWCDGYHWNKLKERDEPNHTMESDFVLESDDLVLVPEAIIRF